MVTVKNGKKTRIIEGEQATLVNGAWQTEDGRRYWFCHGTQCPGLRWSPRNTPHPTSCLAPPLPTPPERR